MILIVSEIAITIAYLLLFARVIIFVAQDRRLPAYLKNVNRYGVPIRSILVQAGIVALATILLFVGVPTLFVAIVSTTDFATEIYNVMQAGTTVIWLISVIGVNWPRPVAVAPQYPLPLLARPASLLVQP